MQEDRAGFDREAHTSQLWVNWDWHACSEVWGRVHGCGFGYEVVRCKQLIEAAAGREGTEEKSQADWLKVDPELVPGFRVFPSWLRVL